METKTNSPGVTAAAPLIVSPGFKTVLQQQGADFGEVRAAAKKAILDEIRTGGENLHGLNTVLVSAAESEKAALRLLDERGLA